MFSNCWINVLVSCFVFCFVFNNNKKIFSIHTEIYILHNIDNIVLALRLKHTHTHTQMVLHLFCCIPSFSDNPSSIIYSASNHNICAVLQLLHIHRPGNPFAQLRDWGGKGGVVMQSWGCTDIIVSFFGVMWLLFRSCEECTQEL